MNTNKWINIQKNEKIKNFRRVGLPGFCADLRGGWRWLQGLETFHNVRFNRFKPIF